MKGGPKSSLRPFLHLAIQLKIFSVCTKDFTEKCHFMFGVQIYAFVWPPFQNCGFCTPFSKVS